MKTNRIVSRLVCLSICLVHAFVGTFIAAAADPPLTQPGGKITLNAMINNQGAIHAMDNNLATYAGIRIEDGTITELSATPFDAPTLTLPPGAAIYPGFIDSHSHAISLPMAAMKSPGGNLYWTSLANVNVMMLPPCPGPSPCYQPVTTQAQVETLLSGKANDINWVLGWNYEPSRLTCDSGRYGFLCPNYENQLGGGVTALEALDKISKTTPILVTSQSGHLVYVNSAALAKLNICGTPGANDQCYRPIFNPDFETRLANQGQLDEDLALYAIGFVENLIASNYGPSYYTDQLVASLQQYSSLGYTTVQEGAASAGLIQTYMNLAVQLAAKGTYLPATMAFLGYDGTTAGDIGPSVQSARTLQAKMTAGGYDMFIAGMKAYSDGSTQGYTGDLAPPNQYYKLPQQFRAVPDYDGLPDYDGCEVTVAAREAHRYGFPLWVHTNGNQAQTNVINSLIFSRSPKVRDVIIHFTMPTQQQVNTVAANGIGATFLVNDFYYYYQPLCEQMLGPQFEATANLYPTKWAGDAGLFYGLHSDVSVTPPSPMFGIWVASTRNVQQVAQHPLLDGCQAAQLNQKITRGDALKAYTSAAAWLYNRETKIGSLQKGYAGDLVVLSADPYDQNTDLSKVCVLYTIHNGNVVYSAPNCTPPVWPS